MTIGARARALPLLLLVATAACGGEKFSDPGPFSDREASAAKLVGTYVHERVTCRDNGAVNSESLSDYPVGYTCRNEDADYYFTVVSSKGALTSLSGPLHLEQVGHAPNGPPNLAMPMWRAPDGSWRPDTPNEPPAVAPPAP